MKATVVDGSLRRIYAAAQQSEAHKRVQLFTRAAEEALKAEDFIGAANNYRLALQNAEDPHVRARLEEVQQLAAANKKRK